MEHKQQGHVFPRGWLVGFMAIAPAATGNVASIPEEVWLRRHGSPWEHGFVLFGCFYAHTYLVVYEVNSFGTYPPKCV
jgi:hypothetical protein